MNVLISAIWLVVEMNSNAVALTAPVSTLEDGSQRRRQYRALTDQPEQADPGWHVENGDHIEGIDARTTAFPPYGISSSIRSARNSALTSASAAPQIRRAPR